jgi:hypothetical protein
MLLRRDAPPWNWVALWLFATNRFRIQKTALEGAVIMISGAPSRTTGPTAPYEFRKL